MFYSRISLIIMILLNCFLSFKLQSYIVLTNVLTDPKTKQKVVIYSDIHDKIDPQVSTNQTELICIKISEAIEASKKTEKKIKILFEAITPDWRLKICKENDPHKQFLIYLTEFGSNFKDVMFNIDNRDFMHNYRECIISKIMLADIDKQILLEVDTKKIPQLITQKKELISKLKKHPFNNTDLKTLQNLYLQDRKCCFNNLEKNLLSISPKIPNEKFKILSDLLKDLKAELFGCAFTKTLEYPETTQSYSLDVYATAPFLDINTLIHILSSPETTCIAFVGLYHSQNLVNLLKQCGYQDEYSFYPDTFYSEEEILTKGCLGVVSSFDEKENKLKNSYRYIDLDDLIPNFDYIVKYVK